MSHCDVCLARLLRSALCGHTPFTKNNLMFLYYRKHNGEIFKPILIGTHAPLAEMREASASPCDRQQIRTHGSI